MEQDIAAQVVGLGGATDFTLYKLFARWSKIPIS